MKKVVFFLFGCVILFSGNGVAGDGSAVFEGLRCGVCHKADTGQRNPSLKEIARVYNTKGEQLISYFKGQAEPVVNPDKSSTMNRYIEKTKAFTEEDRKALAQYILDSLNM